MLVGAGVDNAHASVWKKIKLPSTIAIKHQLRKLMFDDLVERAEKAEKAEKAEVIARAEQFAIIERNKSTLATGAPAASVIVGLKARSRPCVTGRALQGMPFEQDCARHDIQARRGRRETLASPRRAQPVAESHPRGKVHRRNRGRQIAS